ncbi:protein phosphatase, Mg2+/Mn2+ dependent, 1Nb (putative) isoform X1 [Phyllopteryx taeniolatus]|uniref:protein phosphatase, Mg2+/Mn2+ dependent, 1Nb (putative) isoform X1 n=1 Tax=Phyllopteryx taeniolatus TaxID=161469 RepID=UPI002AD53197|nr:protein phosphatase, Mg2+/Mn2+ dependent, 1Nb (putative) isoform X1 [Phyllopteryx taeniolatus]
MRRRPPRPPAAANSRFDIGGMRTSRKASVEMPAFVRQLVKETEKRVSSFFKGGRAGAADVDEDAVLPSPYLDRPVLDKLAEEGCARWGLTYALGSMQGWRAHMEDYHNCVPQLGGGLADWSFFAVFDGHAGSAVARHCSGHLLGHILASGGLGPEDDPDGVKGALAEGFLQTDKHLHAVARREGWERGGTTVVAALVSPRNIYLANCGDSRAVLCRSGQVRFSTEDHKPYSPLEKERIESAGGSVSLQRINGSLAVSRALGDFGYKRAENRSPGEQMVSPEPEVRALERSPADEFLVLACDGVWDAIGNEELCAFVRNRLLVCADLRDVCSQVIDLCLYKGSLDNISIILLCFPGAPQLSAEALHQEAELEDLLESKVAEIYEELRGRGEDPDLLAVLAVLASAAIPGLPPGGGIHSKRNCIISAYYQQRDTHNPALPNGTEGS